MLSLKDYRHKAKGLADLLPYAAMIEPGIILNKDGSFTAASACSGIDSASATKEELAFSSMQFNAAAKSLGTGWMMHVDAFRSPHKAYPRPDESFFYSRVGLLIEDERRKAFSNDAIFTSNTVISLTYKPNFYTAKLASSAQANTSSQTGLEKGLLQFKNTLQEFEELVSSVLHLERLTDYPIFDDFAEKFIQSDLLSHLQQCLTGKLQPVRLPATPMYLDSLLGMEDLIGGISPKFGSKHIAALSIDGLPQASWPAILSCLDALPISYRFNTRFICLDKFEAEKEAESFRKTWTQQVYGPLDKMFGNPNAKRNEDAVTMVRDAGDAIKEIQNGNVGAGYLTSSIVLMNEDAEVLQDNARNLRRTIQNNGFGCRIESINALETWLGTMPGNSFANLRRPYVSTMNLAHLLPLQSVWTGSKCCPCDKYPPKSPPLAVITTDNSTPFWLNLHVGDIGHTLIIGPTGSGKSTLLAFLAAQFERYKNSQVFAFDKGMSLYPLTVGVKGAHYDIGNADEQVNGKTLAFAPLQNIDSPTEFSWATDWIETLLELQGFKVLANHRISINNAMLALKDSPKHLRKLSDFYFNVADNEIKEALSHYTTQGPMGHLLDAAEDTLGLSSFTVFEIETLMNMGEKNLLPVLLYIFHRIEQSLDGRPTFLILDEAWIMLCHPIFKEKIREWLKTLRKKNCAVILATQSLSDAGRSGILDVINESCLTKFFLANLTARQEDQSRLYADLNCNSRMIEIIATATPKRDYYIVTPAGKRLVQLALGDIALAFTGASDPESIQRIKALREEYGPDDWQTVWIKERTGLAV